MLLSQTYSLVPSKSPFQSFESEDKARRGGNEELEGDEGLKK